MSSGDNKHQSGVAPLAAVGLAAILTLAGGERMATALIGGEARALEARSVDTRVVSLSSDPRVLPAPRTAGVDVWLIGNSHTYALPGRVEGEALRADDGSTVAYGLADRIRRRLRTDDVSVTRMAHPNFLPIEMLACTSAALDRGHRPDAIVLGVAWWNLGRGSGLRPRIEDLLASGDVLDRLQDRLDRQGADPRLARTLTTEAAASTARLESATSDADLLEELAMEHVGSWFDLVGASPTIRGAIYREIAYGIDEWLVRHEGRAFEYSVVPSDLELGLAAIAAMLRMWRDAGIDHVLVYLAPERHDLAPLLDPAPRAAAVEALAAAVRRQGYTFVDASAVVGDDQWGWERSTPDRAHFGEAGHAALAEVLADGPVGGAFFDGVTR